MDTAPHLYPGLRVSFSGCFPCPLSAVATLTIYFILELAQEMFAARKEVKAPEPNQTSQSKVALLKLSRLPARCLRCPRCVPRAVVSGAWSDRPSCSGDGSRGRG